MTWVMLYYILQQILLLSYKESSKWKVNAFLILEIENTFNTYHKSKQGGLELFVLTKLPWGSCILSFCIDVGAYNLYLGPTF